MFKKDFITIFWHIFESLPSTN